MTAVADQGINNYSEETHLHLLLHFFLLEPPSVGLELSSFPNSSSPILRLDCLLSSRPPFPEVVYSDLYLNRTILWTS